MTFTEAFEKVKKTAAKCKPKNISEHLAIQINLTDDDANGICYLEISNGNLNFEPYDYYDNDAVFHISSQNLIKLLSGRLNFEKAIETGVLLIDGNVQKASVIKNIIPPPPAKKPAKKTDSKNSKTTKK